MWILKLKSVDSEAEKCGFVKKNSHFFYCLIPKVWFKPFLTVISLCRFSMFDFCLLISYQWLQKDTLVSMQYTLKNKLPGIFIPHPLHPLWCVYLCTACEDSKIKKKPQHKTRPEGCQLLTKMPYVGVPPHD